MTGASDLGRDPGVVGAVDLSAVLGRLSGVLYAEETLHSVLRLVTALAAEVLPRSFGAGVTLLRGRVRSTAATHPLVEEADALQYELDEGPCLSAARDQRTYRIESMWNEERWPLWTGRVAQLGLGSSVSSPLVVRGDGLGAVKVYARPEAAFTDHDERILELFAEKASVTLTNAISHEDARRLSEELREALRSRDVIGQAKGILRERHRVDEETAFGMLAEEAQRTNVKLRTVAQRLLDSAAPSSG
ncbi:GAF and ANTAR domain-containing protein [Blastococcus deserti]